MANTTTDVGRLVVQHPDLGSDGGSTLHTQVRTAWTKWADMISDRYYEQDALADSASVDFEHNFKSAYGELKVFLFTRVVGTGELTRVVDGGTPDLADFTIEATPGALTTQIRITNNTGSAQDISIIVIQGNETLSQLYDMNLSGLGDGQVMIYNSATSKWVPGNALAWNSVVKAIDYSASVNDRVFVDTSGGVVRITLPASAARGASVELIDEDGSWDTNDLEFIPSGVETINGTTGVHTYSIGYGAVRLISNGSGDWRAYYE